MARVLLVDDQKFDLRMAERLLQRDSRWRVVTAANGPQALDILRRESIDVVVTDLVMPEMDGLELLGELQQQLPDLPVVIMTSCGSEETAVRALQAGAASYVNKKHLRRDLADVLKNVTTASLREDQNTRLLMYLLQGAYSFRLPNDEQMVFAVIGFLQDSSQRLQVIHRGEWTRLGIALEEALSNAMIHGNLEIGSELRDDNLDAYQKLVSMRMKRRPFCHRYLHVSARFSPGEARFIIRDEGPGFDPTTIPDPTDPQNLTRPYGRGLFLMHQFMDAVEFNETGNEITLLKRCTSVPSAETAETPEAQTPVALAER